MAFLLLYAITIILNFDSNLKDNLKDYPYIFLFLILLYGYDVSKTREKFRKEIKILSNAIIIITFLLSFVCLITYIIQVTITYQSIITKDYSYIGIYLNRLWGIYNPNTGGTLCLLSIALSILCMFILRKKEFISLYIINILLQYSNLVLNQSRASFIGLTVFAFLIVFFGIKKGVKKLRETNMKNVLLRAAAGGLTVLIIILSFNPASILLSYLPKIYNPDVTEQSSEDENFADTAPEASLRSNNGLALLSYKTLNDNDTKEYTSQNSFPTTDVQIRRGDMRDSTSGRIDLWKAGLKAFLKAPIFGSTRAGLFDAVSPYLDEGFYSTIEIGGVHNIYLTVLISSGIVGFLVLGVFVILSMIKMLKLAGNADAPNKDWYMPFIVIVAMLVSIFVVEFFEARILYFIGAFAAIFWIYYGFSMYYVDKDKQDNGENPKKDNFFAKIERKITKIIKRGKENPEKSKLIKRLLGNSGWLMTQKVYSLLITFVVGALAARYLGPSNYGLIGYGESVVLLFTAVCTLGMEHIIVNDLVANKEATGEILGSALIMRLVTSFMSIGIITLFVMVLNPGNTLLLWITGVQSLALVFQMYEVLDYWFQSRLLSKYSVIGGMIASTVVAAWRIVLLIIGASVGWFAMSYTIQALVCGVVVWVLFNAKSDIKLKATWDMMKKILSRSYHFIISGIAIMIYLQTDKIMIGSMLGDTATGYYVAASKIANLWYFIPVAIINSARPVILEVKLSNYAGYIKRFQMLLLALTGLGVIVALGFTLFGEQAISIIYGKDYLPGAASLYTCIWATIFSVIGLSRNIWLMAEGLYKYTKYFTICGAIVNVGFNAIMIPYIGIIGAAIGTLLTEVTVSLIMPLFFKKTRVFDKIFFSSFNLLLNHKRIGE
ncbi:MAG: oligosaccharide flippase family protein [Eubacteriales bacterium]